MESLPPSGPVAPSRIVCTEPLSPPVFAPVVCQALLFKHNSLLCSLSLSVSQTVLTTNPSSSNGRLQEIEISHFLSSWPHFHPERVLRLLFRKCPGKVSAESPPTRTMCSFIGMAGRMENLYQLRNAGDTEAWRDAGGGIDLGWDQASLEPQVLRPPGWRPSQQVGPVSSGPATWPVPQPLTANLAPFLQGLCIYC